MEQAKDFPPPPPQLRALLLCDAIAVDPATQKLSVLGMFDNVTAFGYPVAISGAVVFVVSDVRTPLEFSVEIVGYPKDEPLGQRVVFGTASVVPPPIGHTVTIFIQGALVFPVTEAGTADVFVKAGIDSLGHRSVPILQAGNLG